MSMIPSTMEYEGCGPLPSNKAIPLPPPLPPFTGCTSSGFTTVVADVSPSFTPVQDLSAVPLSPSPQSADTLRTSPRFSPTENRRPALTSSRSVPITTRPPPSPTKSVEKRPPAPVSSDPELSRTGDDRKPKDVNLIVHDPQSGLTTLKLLAENAVNETGDPTFKRLAESPPASPGAEGELSPNDLSPGEAYETGSSTDSSSVRVAYLPPSPTTPIQAEHQLYGTTPSPLQSDSLQAIVVQGSAPALESSKKSGLSAGPETSMPDARPQERKAEAPRGDRASSTAVPFTNTETGSNESPHQLDLNEILPIPASPRWYWFRVCALMAAIVGFFTVFAVYAFRDDTINDIFNWAFPLNSTGVFNARMLVTGPLNNFAHDNGTEATEKTTES